MVAKNEESLIQQLRKVIKDGLDYLHSLVVLLQARTAELVLSSVLFIFLVGFACLFALVALVLLNVVLGIWLAQTLGNPLYAVLILALCYFLLAVLSGFKALNWLKNLKS